MQRPYADHRPFSPGGTDVYPIYHPTISNNRYQVSKITTGSFTRSPVHIGNPQGRTGQPDQKQIQISELESNPQPSMFRRIHSVRASYTRTIFIWEEYSTIILLLNWCFVFFQNMHTKL